MPKIPLFIDKAAMTNKYRNGTLPSGYYRFHIGVMMTGYLINKADAEQLSGINTAPQFIKSNQGIFMGSLKLLTILEKIGD